MGYTTDESKVKCRVFERSSGEFLYDLSLNMKEYLYDEDVVESVRKAFYKNHKSEIEDRDITLYVERPYNENSMSVILDIDGKKNESD